jgi:hypothetical protein
MQFIGFNAKGTDGSDITRMSLLFVADPRTTSIDVSTLTANQQTQLRTAIANGDQAALATLALSFVPNGTDFQAVLDNAAQAISDGQARITQIAADRTTLAGAGTLAAIKPIEDRQLAAEAVLIQNLIMLIRVLRRMV